METKEKTIEYPIGKDQNGNFMKLRKVYDNGGKTVDRYTATFEMYNPTTGKWEVFTEGFNCGLQKTHPQYDKLYCLGMSENPFHPQGFGQSSTCIEGRHLGKKVKFSTLPEDVEECIMQYMNN